MTDVKTKKQRRKRGVLDKYQKQQVQKTRATVEEAIKAIRATGERETTIELMEKTELSKPTVIKYWRQFLDVEKKEKEERERRQIEESGFIEAFPGMFLEDFMSEVDDTLREMNNRIEKASFLKFLLSPRARNLPFQRADYIRAHRPFFERRIAQLNKSLTIQTRINQKRIFFEEEIQHQLLRPLLKFFYTFFFGFGLDKYPEKLKNCKIIVDFDPFEGTIKFLAEQINKAEWCLANGRFQNLSDFESIMSQLLKDHVEHYRLTSIERGTFSEKDFEEFKKNILNFAKRQILARIDREEVEMLVLAPFIDTNLEIDKREKAAILDWETHLKKLIDNYASSSSYHSTLRYLSVSE